MRTTTKDPAAELLDRVMHTPEGRRDPYPLLGELVSTHEHVLLEDGSAFVLGYHRASEVLRAPRFLKGGEHVSSAQPNLTAEQVRTLARERPPDPGMLSSIDDPDHKRLRRLVSVAFAPKAVDRYVGLVESALDDVLARVDWHDPVDLVPTLGVHVPAHTVGELIGLPLTDRVRFAELARVQSLGRDPGSSYEQQLAGVRALREMYEFVAAMIADARDGLGADTPIARLLDLEREGERISHEELVSLVATLYVAGFGTTVRMIGNGLVALLRHPDQAQWLRDNPDRARQVTDEVLRYDTPVMTVANYAAEGATVGDQRLPKGALCTVVLGAANHDPRVHEDPEVFDVRRVRSQAPLSFGLGIHYCIGAPLARLEADVVFSRMVTRFPRMELAEEPEREDSFRNRAYTSISVVLEP